MPPDFLGRPLVTADLVERAHRLGVEVHTQVVLCPGWNDAAHLDRTIDDLWSLGDGILSLSVVPVGLTKYRITSYNVCYTKLLRSAP